MYPLITDGHVGCFHLLVTVSNAAVNMGVRVSVPVPAFIPLRLHPEVQLLSNSV